MSAELASARPLKIRQDQRHGFFDVTSVEWLPPALVQPRQATLDSQFVVAGVKGSALVVLGFRGCQAEAFVLKRSRPKAARVAK
jgi:hypothetical protein